MTLPSKVKFIKPILGVKEGSVYKQGEGFPDEFGNDCYYLEGTKNDLKEAIFIQLALEAGYCIPVDERWKPKNGQLFYFIDYKGEVEKGIWIETNWENGFFKSGNCYPNLKYAEQAALRVRQAYRGDQVKENLEVLEDIKHVACELNCRPHAPRC